MARDEEGGLGGDGARLVGVDRDVVRVRAKVRDLVELAGGDGREARRRSGSRRRSSRRPAGHRCRRGRGAGLALRVVVVELYAARAGH